MPHPIMDRTLVKHFAIKILRMGFLSIFGFLLVFVLFLYGCQHRMIYFPRSYDAGYREMLEPKTEKIAYETAGGRQVAYYIAPAESPAEPATPRRIWMMFHGNAALALDWIEFVEKIPDGEAAYLLFDYPGFGHNQGKAWATTTLESSQAALAALAGHLGIEQEALGARLNLMGYSIGAAAALRLAQEIEVNRLVLLAPFTSMVAMGRRVVGWPLCHLVRDRYDNRAALAQLAQRNPRPRVTIIHGTADDVVPFTMGRELARTYQDWIEFTEIPGADHNWLLSVAEAEILNVMVDTE